MVMRPLCGRGRGYAAAGVANAAAGVRRVGRRFATELADRNAAASRLDASVASTTTNSIAETVTPPSASAESGGGGGGGEDEEVVAAQLPHVNGHFFTTFLHFFVFFRHWSVGHPSVFAGNSFSIFFEHLPGFLYLSWQAASVRSTHTAAARATSSALRISPEAEPATEWATPKVSPPDKKENILVVVVCSQGGNRVP